jgi:hypothetical protein
MDTHKPVTILPALVLTPAKRAENKSLVVHRGQFAAMIEGQSSILPREIKQKAPGTKRPVAAVVALLPISQTWQGKALSGLAAVTIVAPVSGPALPRSQVRDSGGIAP